MIKKFHNNVTENLQEINYIYLSIIILLKKILQLKRKEDLDSIKKYEFNLKFQKTKIYYSAICKRKTVLRYFTNHF